MNTKVLIITYYWPPSGGAGVQRWVKLTKYLSRMGVECHVLTVDENSSSYLDLDESLNDDVADSIQVYKTNSFEPNKIYARIFGKNKLPVSGSFGGDKGDWKNFIVNFVRSNLFIPDPRKFWNFFAFRQACEIIKKHKIKTIITSSPPHSTQLIGLKLKKKFNIRWIVDFRDPWTDIYYYSLLRHSKLSHRRNIKLETEVLESADVIMTVSKGLKDLFSEKLNNKNLDRFFILPNGYDPDDFNPKPKKILKDTVIITYTGTISEQYDPESFFEALSRVTNKVSKKIIFKIIGSIPEDLKTKLRSYDFEVVHIPPVPHSEITDFQQEADILLLVIPNVEKADGILTGKLFEYLATRNTIICLGPAEGDAAYIINECNLGKTFERDQIQDITNFLIGVIEGSIVLNPDDGKIREYSRKVQAEKVLNYIQ